MDKSFFTKKKPTVMGGDSSNLAITPKNTQAQIQQHLAGVPTDFEIDYMVVTDVKDSEYNLDRKQNQELDEGSYGAITGIFKISEGDTLRKGITAYPLDKGNFELPIPGESVPVIIYGDTYYYLDKKISHGGQFSYSPQLAGLTQTDKIEVQKKLLLYKSVGNIKKQPLSGRGSKQINSRFGSSIIFDNNRTFQSGNPTKPTLRLSNNQSQETPLFYNPSLSREGSTILLTSGDSEEDLFTQLPLNGITPTLSPYYPTEKDTIVIDTDRLILQTQDGSVFMNSSDDFIINGRNVYINNEPAVEGKRLQTYLGFMIELLEKLANGILKTNGRNAAGGEVYLDNQIKILKDRLNMFLAIEGNHLLTKKTLEQRSKANDLYIDEPTNPGTSEKRRKVATVYSLKGDVTINEKAAKPKQKLKEGDVIQTKLNPLSTIVWKWSVNSGEYKLPMGKTITIQDPTEFPGGIEDITPPGEKVFRVVKVVNDVLVNGRPTKMGNPIRVGDKIHLGPMGFLATIDVKTKQAAKFSGSNRDVSGSTGGTARTAEYDFVVAEQGVIVQVFEQKRDRKNYIVRTSVSVASIKG